MEYKYEGKQRPRNWSCQCVVHLGLSKKQLMVVVPAWEELRGLYLERRGRSWDVKSYLWKPILCSLICTMEVLFFVDCKGHCVGVGSS